MQQIVYLCKQKIIRVVCHDYPHGFSYACPYRPNHLDEYVTANYTLLAVCPKEAEKEVENNSYFVLHIKDGKYGFVRKNTFVELMCVNDTIYTKLGHLMVSEHLIGT